MSKHVVNIVPAFIPGDGIGNAARVRVAGLIERGYRVSVICATAKIGTDEFAGLNLLQAGAGWEADSSSLTQEMFATIQSADLVFVDFGCFNICHELLKDFAAPLVLFYHGLTPAALMQSDMYSSCYYRAVGELRKLPSANLVLAASRFALDEYTRIAGSAAQECRIVPQFGNSQLNDANFSEPSKRSPLKLLTVGQMFPHKNYEVLIDAARILADEGLDIEVRHIGGANDLIAHAYRERLIRLAKPLGSKFQFLGKVEQEVLDQNYRNADIVVIPSLHEGYSLPAREALLHGKPVFASSFGALPETLQGAAEHFHPLDPRELASKIRQAATWSDEQWQRVRQRSLDAAPNHSKQRYVQECIDAIESTLRADTVDAENSQSGNPSSNSHVSTIHSNDRICGKIRLPLSSLDTKSISLEACVVTGQQIIHPRLHAKLSWTESTEGMLCYYELPLKNAEDWTAAYIRFVNVQSRARVLEIPGISIERETAISRSECTELRRLAESIAECYRPKSIVATDKRLVTKIKTHVANTLLRLIYQVFIGPQMAIMQSQLRLFSREIATLRSEVRTVRDPQQISCAPEQHTCEEGVWNR